MAVQSLSNWFRGRRDRLLHRVIAGTARRGERLEILDLGGRADYWRRVGYDFLRVHGAHITILNLTETEQHIQSQAPGDLFTYVTGNACALDYGDNSFDLAHANSVIEHVGLWRDMEDFAREARRAAPTYYIQTPNFWFPIDPHFWRLPLFHWLPRPLRARLLQWLPLATAGRAKDVGAAYRIVDSARLLGRRQMAHLFPDARLHAERLLLVKSYTAVRVAH